MHIISRNSVEQAINKFDEMMSEMDANENQWSFYTTIKNKTLEFAVLPVWSNSNYRYDSNVNKIMKRAYSTICNQSSVDRACNELESYYRSKGIETIYSS